MPVTVNPNSTSVVHKPAQGITIAFPDVCKTPAPQGPIPIPYPSVATTARAAQQKAVKVQGSAPMISGSAFKSSVGDAAGTSRRMVSSGSFAKVGSATPATARNLELLQLTDLLNQHNAKIRSLRSRDPNEWQAALEGYVVAASALYRTLYPDD